MKNEVGSEFDPKDTIGISSSGLVSNELQQNSAMKERALITLVYPDAFAPMMQIALVISSPFDMDTGQLAFNSKEISNPSRKLR